MAVRRYLELPRVVKTIYPELFVTRSVSEEFNMFPR